MGTLAERARAVRRAIHNFNAYIWVGIVFTVAAVIVAIVILTSTDGLVWTGKPIPAEERGGIVFYAYRGQTYSINVAGSYQTRPCTVYIDPSNPFRAVEYSVALRAVEIFYVFGPLAIGGGFIAFGRARLRKHRQEKEADNSDRFGHGLDLATIQQLRAQQQVQTQQPKASPWSKPWS